MSLKEGANSVDYIFPNYVPHSFEETCVETIRTRGFVVFSN
jgi:hypothetical protein